MPSLNEALSNVCSNPWPRVLRSSRPASAERRKRCSDGDTGLLVPPGDSTALADRDRRPCSTSRAGRDAWLRGAGTNLPILLGRRDVRATEDLYPTFWSVSSARGRSAAASVAADVVRQDVLRSTQVVPRLPGFRRSEPSGTTPSSAGTSRIRSCSMSGCGHGGSASAAASGCMSLSRATMSASSGSHR